MGPAAIPKDYCTIDRAEAGWRVSAGYGWLSSTIEFGGGLDVDFTQRSAVAGVSRRLGDRFTLQLSGGAVLGGDWNAPGAPGTLRTGPVVQLSGTWMVLEGRGAVPFVALSSGLAGMWTRTSGAGNAGTADLSALDLSVSATVGKAVLGFLAPYAGAKLFGGPVRWSQGGTAVTGSDAHHYQVALGLAAALPKGLDLLVEGAFLGQRSVTASLGWAF